MLLVVSHFTLILLLSFFSVRFFLLWKNVSRLIIPFFVLPLAPMLLLLLLLHLNSATRTHISKQKMTVLLVFFHVFWNVMALVQQRAYFKSVKILLVCFKHFCARIFHHRRSVRARETPFRECRKYVGNMWKKRSVYKKQICTHTNMKKSFDVHIRLWYWNEKLYQMKLNDSAVCARIRFCCFHKYQSNTQNWDPYFRLFTFDWAQLRIKTCATHTLMNEKKRKFGQSKMVYTLKWKIVLQCTQTNKALRVKFDGSTRYKSNATQNEYL